MLGQTAFWAAHRPQNGACWDSLRSVKPHGSRQKPKKTEHAGTLLMIFPLYSEKIEYSHGNTTNKYEYHQTGADTSVTEGVGP